MLQTFYFFCDILFSWIGGEEGMTQKENEQAREIEKLKKIIKQKDIKIKDLEIEKKTLLNKLKIQNEQYEDLEKENKTKYYKNKYELALQEKNIMKKQYESQLKAKEDYIANITVQLHKDSTNSNKPSSTDGYKKKIHNCREKTGKKQGGQIGHKYHESKLIENPDKAIKVRKVHRCECGGKIEYNKNEIVRRQIIDILTKYYVTEYQGQMGKCKKCGKEYFPKFPKGIAKKVQYGDTVKGLSMIFSEHGNISVDKVKEIIGILTNSEGPSEGSIMNWKSKSYENMKPIMEDIKEEMLKEAVINNDETPYRINGKLKYAIGSFTPNLSAIECNGGREKEAFDKMNIFPRYTGIVVGDHYAVNESFQGQTAYCNAHTIRAAKGVLDIRKCSKAMEYINFMYRIKEEVDKSKDSKLSNNRYEKVKEEYEKLLKEWKEEFSNFVKDRNKACYDDERKLINLLLKYIEGHLMFAKESKVPFTNNDAERRSKTNKNKNKSYRRIQRRKIFKWILQFVKYNSDSTKAKIKSM